MCVCVCVCVCYKYVCTTGEKMKLICLFLCYISYRDGHCVQPEDKILTYSQKGYINMTSKNMNTGKLIYYNIWTYTPCYIPTYLYLYLNNYIYVWTLVHLSSIYLYTPLCTYLYTLLHACLFYTDVNVTCIFVCPNFYHILRFRIIFF